MGSEGITEVFREVTLKPASKAERILTNGWSHRARVEHAGKYWRVEGPWVTVSPKKQAASESMTLDPPSTQGTHCR